MKRKLQIRRPMWLLVVLLILGAGTMVLAQSNEGQWAHYFNVASVDAAVAAFKQAKSDGVLPDACDENRGQTLTIKASGDQEIGLFAICNNRGGTTYYAAEYAAGAWQYRHWGSINPSVDIYDDRQGDTWQVRSMRGAYVLLPVEQMIAPSPTPMPTLGPATPTPMPTATRPVTKIAAPPDGISLYGAYVQIDSSSAQCSMDFSKDGKDLLVFSDTVPSVGSFSTGQVFYWLEAGNAPTGTRCYYLFVQDPVTNLQDYTEAEPFLVHIGDVLYIGKNTAAYRIAKTTNGYVMLPVKVLLNTFGTEVPGYVLTGSTDCTQNVIFCVMEVGDDYSSLLIWGKASGVEVTPEVTVEPSQTPIPTATKSSG